MTLRPAQRPLNGDWIVGDVEVLTGESRDGQIIVSIQGSGARSGSTSISDPEVLRRLIGDLRAALAHLDPTSDPLGPNGYSSWSPS